MDPNTEKRARQLKDQIDRKESKRYQLQQQIDTLNEEIEAAAAELDGLDS